MSTKFMILSKPNDLPITNNEQNQVIMLNSDKTYILPQVIVDYYSTKGLFESNMIEWTKELCKKDKVFLDIGAHTGSYSISLAKHVKEVHAFEPQKNTYYALCGGVVLSNLDNVTCHHFGLGSEEQVGEKVLKIVSNDGGGSSLHATENILREERIEVRTLDSLQVDNIGFIKMDVEENEYYVLLGATETLKRSNYPTILFEYNYDYNDKNYDDNILFNYLKKDLRYKVIQLRGSSNMFLATMN